MPDISQYDNMDDWMSACIPVRIAERDDRDQAVAVCMSQWTEKNAAKYSTLWNAIKAVGDWELDVLAIPFHVKDSDGQWFDEQTDIMPDAFQTPLIVYQHGIEQGAKRMQEKPLIIGKSVAGTLKKMVDGWHVRVILDKTVQAAKTVMDAAKRGMVSVSSGSISHLARLDIGGKLIKYEKNRPGRIAVWALGEVSLWERGNGNITPASPFAVAMPVMKAMYRDAGLPFPDLRNIHGDVPEADDAAHRARIAEIKRETNRHLSNIEKLLGESS